jgi:DNA polymerase I
LRGVAFRSRRAEPFGEAFLRRAIERLLAGDVAGVRQAYVECTAALRARELPCFEVSAEVRLTKAPEQYAATREQRRELAYEALLGSGRSTWSSGERVRVYRALGGRAALLPLDEDADEPGAADRDSPADPRDYDAEYYVRLLRDTFAARLARALEPEVFAEVFADPRQLGLFTRSLVQAQPILTRLREV